jgi:glycosyltransferase involved in cell wall biosynthesis
VGEYSSALHILANTKFMTKQMLNGIDYPIVVSSQFMMKQMRDLGLKNNIYLLPAGVDTKTFCPPPRENLDRDKIRLLYYGHLTPNKGVKNLVGAISRITQEFKGLELHIYWSGYGSRKEVDRLIGKLNLQNYVSIWKEKIDVPSLLHTVDIGILPLVSPVGTASPPTSLLEMMASKIPVVATNVGGVSEIIQDGVNGILCEPNEESLANGIIRLISDKTLREKIGEEARKLMVEKFDWELVVDRYLEFYEDITDD